MAMSIVQSSPPPIQRALPNFSIVLDEARELLALAAPLMLTSVAQLALTSTNLILIGSLGPRAIASAALATALYQGVIVFCTGLVSATMPIMASELSRDDSAMREVRDIVHQGFWTAATLSIVGWVILWNCDAIYAMFGQDVGLRQGAGEMMRSLQWSMLPALGYVVLRSFLAAKGQPMLTLPVALLAVIFNAICAWALIDGHLGLPAMGLGGAGLASTLASTVMFVGLMIMIAVRHDLRCYRLFERLCTAGRPQLMPLWRLGVPIGIVAALDMSVFYASGNIMGWLGMNTLAAHSITMQVTMIFFMVPSNLAQATTVRVGRAVGLDEWAKVRAIGLTALGLGSTFMLFTSLTFLLAPHFLIGLFIDTTLPANAPIINLGTTLLAVAAIFQIADAVQIIGTGVLRGLQDTAVPMVLAIIGYWCIGIPLGLVLTFQMNMGGAGVWLGLAIALIVVSVLMTWRWVSLSTASRGRRN
jgi:MATE family multidrug resistance protein